MYDALFITAHKRERGCSNVLQNSPNITFPDVSNLTVSLQNITLKKKCLKKKRIIKTNI